LEDPVTGAADLLKRLNALWADLRRQEGSESVLRACAMTLIVVTNDAREVNPAGEVVAAVMPEYPSRAVVVKVCHTAEKIEAGVSAQCWRPFGKMQQVCAEQVEIAANPAALDEVAPLLLGLVVPDLPVVAWFRESALALSREFAPAVRMADKVVLDSRDWSDAGEALRACSAVRASGTAVADLNWTRLTRWREAIAQLFEAAQNRELLPDISSVVIGHRGTAVPATAYYLAGWVRQSLGREVPIRFDPGDGEWEGNIREIRFETPGGPVGLTREARDMARISGGRLEACAHFGRIPEHVLLGTELGLLTRDAIYDRVLQLACAMLL
jgi:glucose-6-phosphate dehydrogenase assembly protein OpcA